ncbi:MAG: YbbR-like domain-containing protein, partial [Bacteroidales bacterium]
NFLSRAQSKELLTFLFFLCLSFLFWILQSMNEESEAIYRIPIKYRNIPEDIIFMNNPPAQLSLRIKDKGIILLNYSIGRPFVPVDIDVKSLLNNSKGVIRIKDEQLENVLKKQLNGSSTILSLTPDTINIHYSKQGDKLVPVVLNASLLAGAQYQVGEEVRLKPDSVRVFAARTILDTLQSVSTQYLHLTDLSDTVIQRVALMPIKKAKIVPASVEVFIPVEEYTEKTMTLPITVLGLPDTLMLRTFPSTVQLSCFVGLRDFKDITAESFSVAVNYEDISKLKGNRLPVEVVNMPLNVTNIRCQPDSVEFIIEEKE